LLLQVEGQVAQLSVPTRRIAQGHVAFAATAFRHGNQGGQLTLAFVCNLPEGCWYKQSFDQWCIVGRGRTSIAAARCCVKVAC
jgi:hypothetical protein